MTFSKDLEFKLYALAFKAVDVFKLPPFTDIHFVDECSLPACYGFIDETDTIEVRVKQTHSNKRFSIYTVVDTLSHELAHLAFRDHSREQIKLVRALKVFFERNLK